MASIDDIAVLTSENVRLMYSLAGLGSRLIAAVIDLVIIGLAETGITLIILSLGVKTEDLTFASGGTIGGSFIAAVYWVVATVISFGYFFFFEWISWGQTPGKQIMNIRVSMVNGAPADLVACAVRNVLRIVDLLLAGLGITFFIMIFTPKFQRLGDLAAGTVVVKRRNLSFRDVLNASEMSDRSMQTPIQMSGTGTGTGTTPSVLRINEAEASVIARFIERRETLPPSVRHDIAKDLAGRLRSRMGKDLAVEMQDEELLETALGQFKKRTDV
jgi:uncharacterized RDD family membrane protein YckC